MSRIAKGLALTSLAAVAVAGTAGIAAADAGAEGQAVGSPGILSGNVIQVPINIPINVCGNTIDVIGLLNPAVGNTCVNGDIDESHHHHGKHHGDHHGGDHHDGGWND
jgi:ChpA-C